MREIKFRAWDKEITKMLHNVETGFSMGSCFGDVLYEVDKGKMILMQYTGLKDKNGKEIYEGDICRAAKSFICSISFDLYDGIIIIWAYMNARSKLIGEMTEPMWKNHEVSIEVIGNIYENPELLKEEK